MRPNAKLTVPADTTINLKNHSGKSYKVIVLTRCESEAEVVLLPGAVFVLRAGRSDVTVLLPEHDNAFGGLKLVK